MKTLSAIIIGAVIFGMNANAHGMEQNDQVSVTPEHYSSVINGENVIIYEGFQLQKINNNDKGSQSDSVVGSNSEVIAKLGRGFNVVKSDTNDGVNIAYIQPVDNANMSYVVQTTITYTCYSEESVCIDDDTTTTHVPRSYVYRVEVNDFAEWRSVMSSLKDNAAVALIYPSYNFGYRTSVN